MRPIDVVALVATVMLCGIGPVIAALALGRRLRLQLRIVAIAGGCYVINLVLQQPIFAGLRAMVGGERSLLLTAVLFSIVVGVTEEVVRYLSWRAGRSMRDNRTSDGALVAGLAWGGAESLLFTLSIVGGLLAALFAPGMLQGRSPVAVVAAASLGSLLVFAPGRLFAIAGHVAFAHLSVQAYRRSTAFLAVAIAAHVVFDASVFGLGTLLGPQSAWPAVLFAVLAVAAVVTVVWLRRSWTAEDSCSDDHGSRTRDDAPAAHSS
jgi:hypothetical protein